MEQSVDPIRVLVVDDEKTVANTLALILQASGYEATAVYSGEDAVELCRKFDPHIVISDIVMGPMSGFDLAIWVAEHRPACRIILMSAHSFHNPLVAKSMGRGFDFVAKPIQPEKLLAKLAAPDADIDPMKEGLEKTKASEE
jgi:DNA-binding response OmpR family regulator